MILLFAVAMLLPLALVAQGDKDDRHDSHHDRIGHSKRDVDHDQDGILTRHRTEQDGAFAQFNANTSASSLSLSVSRGATNDVASTTLNYSDVAFAPDFSSLTIVNVFGTISNSAFVGDNTSSLVLNLDTSQLDPAVTFSQSCTVDFTTFSETCGPGPLGLIHLAFQENGITRTRILEFDEEQVAGPVTTRIHQRADTGSANMQGTIFGTPASSSQGTATVGVNHTSTLVITRQ
jgi:hypothetical protein